MARTAAPVTPGADPAAASNTTADAGADPAAAGRAGQLRGHGVAAAGAAGGDDEVAKLRAELAEMKALLGQVARQNQPAPAVVKLPTMAEVLKGGKPDSPVLTAEGWYVPAVLPSQRQVG